MVSSTVWPVRSCAHERERENHIAITRVVCEALKNNVTRIIQCKIAVQRETPKFVRYFVHLLAMKLVNIAHCAQY